MIRILGLMPSMLFICALSIYVAPSFGQTETAAVSGRVTDSQGQVVPGVQIQLVNVDTNVARTTNTNSEGLYNIPSVQPGPYRILVLKDGFKEIVKTGLVLHVQDVIAENFSLQVGSVSQSVTVTADGVNINTTDGSVSTVVDRQFVENVPLNGRSFQSLILLTPGITAVPGASTNTSGEFSVNGQRTEANYYTVDGVSANTGATSVNRVGGTPAETALGTTQSLVSIDALQEFRINTSTYSAEYGRSPGAQISFQTRSGTNTWHGSLFDYFRNDALDSNNWFNGAAGLPKTAERQNDFGGTVGGPIRVPGLYNGKDKTFFFFSYEGLRLIVPQAALTTDVPDTALRQNAPAAIQPVLNAFPIQNGADQGNGLALFTGSYSSPSRLDAYSIRMDHSFGDKLQIFGRYADTPSSSATRNVALNSRANFANRINNTSDIKTATIGALSQFASHLINELRFNYTHNINGSLTSLDNFGGATPFTPAQAFAGATLPQYYEFDADLFFGTSPLLILSNSEFRVHQWNITDSVSSTFGAHTLKYGIDYRRQVGTQGNDELLNFFEYLSAGDLLSNAAPFALAETLGVKPPVAIVTNFSAFVQDEWKATNRLHLSLGLRWDLNPAPTGKPKPYTLDQITDLATAKLAPAGTPLWHTEYRGFGPRLGLAYQLRQNPRHETVVRSGFGVFYDVGNFGALSGLFGGVGVGSSTEFGNVAFPFTPAQQVLPSPSIEPPYNQYVNAPDPHLRLPYTLQWNAAIEQELGKNQTLTVSYVGAGGRKLLHQQFFSVSGNPNFTPGGSLSLLTGGSTSTYNSLQVQFKRHLSHGLQVLTSYTWSHAIDDLSSNQFSVAPLLRGNADFDVRHNFSGALTYDLPGGYVNPFAGALLKHWAIDVRQTARSGLPVDIYSGFGALPNGQTVYLRPDLVFGVPLYLYGSQYPGGKAVNSTLGAAVCPDGSQSIGPFCPPAGPNGKEPRNFVRGFAAWQTDLAIRREFLLHDRLKLQFRAESFNLFNHPNFGAIDNFTSDGPTLFGKANSTLNNSLGGANPLYQMGGPRSLQLALKLMF